MAGVSGKYQEVEVEMKKHPRSGCENFRSWVRLRKETSDRS